MNVNNGYAGYLPHGEGLYVTFIFIFYLIILSRLRELLCKIFHKDILRVSNDS